MIKLTTTTINDLEQIREWIAADPWHNTDAKANPEFLLTGGGELAFCLQDDKGPLCYLRLDAEGDMLRLAIQFAPEDQVSKRRLIIGLIKMGIPAMVLFGKNNGYKGIVFWSINPALIAFGDKQGFKPTEVENDFALVFEAEHNV
jgi:hypothetical protein